MCGVCVRCVCMCVCVCVCGVWRVVCVKVCTDVHAGTIIHVALAFVHSLVNNCCKEGVDHFGTFASVNKRRGDVQFLAPKGVRPGQVLFPETCTSATHTVSNC